MPIDGLFFNKLLTELSEDMIDAKINRIHQPDKNTVTMKLNQRQRGNFTLLLSTHPQNARIHITEINKENPKSPPLFAMVLRKHLEGGRIVSITQQGLDRVAEIVIEARNEIGETETKYLYLEIMGKHSNLILTNQEHNILGAIKQFGGTVSRYRQVLPHFPYVSPPPQNKLNPFFLEAENFTDAILSADLETPIKKALYQKVEGLSPQTAEEVLYRANLEAEDVEEIGVYEGMRLFESLQTITEHYMVPTIIRKNGLLKDFYFCPMHHYSGTEESIATLSSLLDTYFTTKETELTFLSQKNNLLRMIGQADDKLGKKIKKQEKELSNATDGEKYKLYGELISSYIYQMETHSKEVTLPNFYDDGKDIVIPLSEELTPSENATRYFKKYNKAKTAKDAIVVHLTENKGEKTYLENLYDSIERCIKERDLEEIHQEAVQSGYIKDKSKKKKEKNDAPLPPFEVTVEEYTIYIGRNNKQNDKLTLKIAAKDDLWLHTKDIPGSHVIIRKKPGKDIPTTVIAKAAAFAAYHSKAKHADKVPVDYTEVQQVKKPNGARPGMVIYFEQTTLFVKPENPFV